MAKELIKTKGCIIEVDTTEKIIYLIGGECTTQHLFNITDEYGISRIGIKKPVNDLSERQKVQPSPQPRTFKEFKTEDVDFKKHFQKINVPKYVTDIT